VTVCAIIAQVQNLPKIWHELDWPMLRPILAGGVIGVPFGAQLLTRIDAETFKTAVGVVLICYSAFMLLFRPRFGTKWGGRFADGIMGLSSGIIGGLTGLSGVLPTIWAVIRGWSKVERRGVFQMFNLTVLTTALIAYGFSGLLTAELGKLVLMAVPGTLIGAWLGFHAYRRLSDHGFHIIVLVLLMAAGVMLIATR